jgi:5-methyltetrahydrofolate--homocysteine methyltransferase
MPEDENDRIVNAKKILDKSVEIGFSLDEIYLDAIVFPISVNSQYGNHYFDAVKGIRKEYGTQLHIGMGLSNVSFGMPMRKLINQAFIYLGLEAGINAGLLDPTQIKLEEVYGIDVSSEKLGLAIDMLTGKDEFCVKYLQAYRSGKLR